MTYGLSDLVDAILGKLPRNEGFALARALVENPDLAAELDAAREVARSLGSDPIAAAEDGTPADQEASVAADLAREQVDPATWGDARATELMLASLRSMLDPPQGEFAASEHTRRRLRNVALGAAATPTSGTARANTRSRRWIAAGSIAAAFLIAFTAIWNMPAGSPWAKQAGLTRGQEWTLPAEVGNDLKTLSTRGQLTEPVFDRSPTTPSAERASDETPVAVFPVWESVASTMPTFEWDVADDARFEVFVVDERRQLVWTQNVADDARSAAYPEGQPALERGSTYYWKVNRIDGSDVVASDYVGFRVLEQDEADRCLKLSRRYADQPLLRGLVFDSCGMYRDAEAAFEEVDAEGRDLARAALEALRTKRSAP